ncbi:matrix protein [Blanchseco virus]|uniref:Matrix protein n=1 Tax=Blanchseco virus TaxID=2704630 RepID=A0A5B8GPH4_9RHAB|nr:matrix protein [Blanchseco virus]QDW81031.1 matrix protein [Blanchseco virus]
MLSRVFNALKSSRSGRSDDSDRRSMTSEITLPPDTWSVDLPGGSSEGGRGRRGGEGEGTSGASAIPSAPPLHHSISFDLDASLTGKGPVPLTPLLIFKLMHEFPASYRGEYRSRTLIYSWVAHLCGTSRPVGNRQNCYSEVKRCISYDGYATTLPDPARHHYHDTFECRYEGNLFTWTIHFDCYPSRIPGTPVVQIFDRSSRPYLKLFEVTVQRDKRSQNLVFSM